MRLIPFKPICQAFPLFWPSLELRSASSEAALMSRRNLPSNARQGSEIDKLKRENARLRRVGKDGTLSPKLAVAVVTDCYAAIRRLVDCLRTQDVRDQLELVVAVPSGGSFALPELAEFARASVVEVESLDPLPAARAAAVRAATAPFVFVGET